MNWRHLLCALALAGASAGAAAADYEVKSTTRYRLPERYSLVNDFMPFLRLASRPVVLRKLEALERRNGTRIVLLTVPSTGDASLEAYARDAFRQWDIGNNGMDTGVLFLVTDSGWQFVTGGAITGAIPDVTLARISRNVMEPAWKRDEVSEGIEQSIDALVKASIGEETPGTAYDYANPHQPYTPQQIGAMVLGAAALGYGAVLLWLRRRKGARA